MKVSSYNQIKNLLNQSGYLNSTKKTSKFNLDYDFNNEIILITGAAGSVGSEITRQLLNFKFKTLILIDNAESPLNDLSVELDILKDETIDFIVLDIRDKDSMSWLFKTYKPSIIFHTAAYKHVPLMENNAYEAVRLNIFATKILADLSVLHKVKKFIFISTDKAVNPISVMGMTKRIAESYLNHLNLNNATFFIITRFGNIMGSNGSVLPVFLKQIESGKKLTLTSKETSRFFISKNKASRLILRTASFSKKQENLFTFNMGNPIKIIDLAKVLIDWFFEETSNKIDIELIGLRPGEKVHEDIFANYEKLEPTKYKDIFKVKHSYKNVLIANKTTLSELLSISSNMKNETIKSILKNYIFKL